MLNFKLDIPISRIWAWTASYGRELKTSMTVFPVQMVLQTLRRLSLEALYVTSWIGPCALPFAPSLPRSLLRNPQLNTWVLNFLELTFRRGSESPGAACALT